MSSATTYRTGLGASDADSITLLGHSLADDRNVDYRPPA